MRRQFSLILTLTAWLLATGSHWDLVQTFAWGRMFAIYSQSMPLLRAAQKTFSAEGMCGVCHAVADAKQKESAADASTPGTAGKSLGKILLVFAPADAPLIIAPVIFPWSLSDQLIPTADRAAPPFPPPRALV
jgi:hypothetical protein